MTESHHTNYPEVNLEIERHCASASFFRGYECIQSIIWGFCILIQFDKVLTFKDLNLQLVRFDVKKVRRGRRPSLINLKKCLHSMWSACKHLKMWTFNPWTTHWGEGWINEIDLCTVKIGDWYEIFCFIDWLIEKWLIDGSIDLKWLIGILCPLAMASGASSSTRATYQSDLISAKTTSLRSLTDWPAARFTSFHCLSMSGFGSGLEAQQNYRWISALMLMLV